ncbi:MAG: 2-dehydropantoate 2-reductase [bacterium]|nr:2-dehydropantoate 2-reductase [bacterium]
MKHFHLDNPVTFAPFERKDENDDAPDPVKAIDELQSVITGRLDALGEEVKAVDEKVDAEIAKSNRPGTEPKDEEPVESKAFVARGPHLDAMKTKGLLVEGSTGDIRLDTVRAVATIAEAGPADLVLFAVKNYDAKQAATDLAASINPEAVIVTVQNGVSAQPHLAEKFGQDRIFPGVVRLVADIKSPGVIRVPAEAEMGGLVFGAYDGKTARRPQAVFDALTESGIGATLSEDIWKTLWEKFIPLSAFSAMTVMTRLDIGPVRETTASRHLLRTLMEETVAVARADHPSVPEDAAETAYEFLMNVPPNVHASMLDVSTGVILPVSAD